jgi:hypothetical protein
MERSDAFRVGQRPRGIKMSDITPDFSAAAARSSPRAEPLIHRLWPQAIIGIGLGVTGAWICILGYGFGRLVGLLVY